LELKKADFMSKIKSIRRKMITKKLQEEGMLRDFDKFYHKKWK